MTSPNFRSDPKKRRSLQTLEKLIEIFHKLYTLQGCQICTHLCTNDGVCVWDCKKTWQL